MSQLHHSHYPASIRVTPIHIQIDQLTCRRIQDTMATTRHFSWTRMLQRQPMPCHRRQASPINVAPTTISQLPCHRHPLHVDLRFSRAFARAVDWAADPFNGDPVKQQVPVDMHEKVGVVAPAVTTGSHDCGPFAMVPLMDCSLGRAFWEPFGDCNCYQYLL